MEPGAIKPYQYGKQTLIENEDFPIAVFISTNPEYKVSEIP